MRILCPFFQPTPFSASTSPYKSEPAPSSARHRAVPTRARYTVAHFPPCTAASPTGTNQVEPAQMDGLRMSVGFRLIGVRSWGRKWRVVLYDRLTGCRYEGCQAVWYNTPATFSATERLQTTMPLPCNHDTTVINQSKTRFSNAGFVPRVSRCLLECPCMGGYRTESFVVSRSPLPV